MACVSNNKPFDFGADPDHDPEFRIQGSLTEFLPLQDRGNDKNFAGSAAWQRFAIA